ncbi:MAG: TAT-variant-translocated molybdopterin oxidoreductase [Thermogutta sp.]
MSSLERTNPENTGLTSRRGPYWRTLEELADTPRFREMLAKEFPHGIELKGLHRRRWLQLMGASLALAGLGGCRWEKEEIAPFVHRPVGRIPGKAERYATAMDLAGTPLGLVATCVDGRPIKLEGNPVHPMSLGGTDVFAQAAVLELYDPDRGEDVVRRDGKRREIASWDVFGDALARFVQSAPDGRGLAVLAEASSSPTLARLRRSVSVALPGLQWFEYEPWSDDNVRLGTQAAFGRPLRPAYRLDQARVIVALDADLFGEMPGSVRWTREFASTRDGDPERMSRLYAVESHHTVTGASADHRLPLSPPEIALFAAGLETALKRLAAGENLAESQGIQADANGAKSDPVRFLVVAALDLWEAGSHGLVVVGPGLPPEVHAAAARINDLLKNRGTTLLYYPALDPERPTHVQALRNLADAVAAGDVRGLLILGGNPAYDAPADVPMAELLPKLEFSAHLSLYENETSRRCGWYLPQAHFLEAWGDTLAWDGTYAVVQPTIEPLRNGKSALEILAMVGKLEGAPMQWVRETFAERTSGEGADAESLWAATLQRGCHSPSADQAAADPVAAAETNDDALAVFAASVRGTSSDASQVAGLTLVFRRDASVHDGRFANSGWLQEFPDPMTRWTWGNPLVMGVGTARRLGCRDGRLVQLDVDGRSVELPVCVLPGVAENTAVVFLGYGREAAGHVGGLVDQGIPPVGVNVHPLRDSANWFVRRNVPFKVLKQEVPVPCVQDHHLIDTVGLASRTERLGELVREVTLKRLNDPEAHYSAEHEVHHPPLESLWTEPSHDGHRWGLSVDLSKCVGCGACVVACQAENNIPVVGKERVLQSREMHWIRVDRYFRGDEENPQSVHQPVMCQQCELAPCEQVCPVAATVHSKEGLNDMVYNRCVGTRYCANNCPYKVRRFNYFYYHHRVEEPENRLLQLVFNPEVTVRSRGVMEKCTYCVQRIQNAKITARNEGRAIADGEIRTACQQACPAQAIVFGDLADEQSAVSREHASARAYGMLAELNVKPRTKYLARVRNPHPLLAAERESADGEGEGHGGHA